MLCGSNLWYVCASLWSENVNKNIWSIMTNCMTLHWIKQNKCDIEVASDLFLLMVWVIFITKSACLVLIQSIDSLEQHIQENNWGLNVNDSLFISIENKCREQNTAGFCLDFSSSSVNNVYVFYANQTQ